MKIIHFIPEAVKSIDNNHQKLKGTRGGLATFINLLVSFQRWKYSFSYLENELLRRSVIPHEIFSVSCLLF